MPGRLILRGGEPKFTHLGRSSVRYANFTVNRQRFRPGLHAEVEMNTELKCRILVVDDEENICKLLFDFLGEEGHEVIRAASGEEALELYRKTPFPLVITDIYLGEMNGLDLLKEIKETDPDSVVVMMTSQASLETAVQATRSGAYDYLFKPFDNLEMISGVVDRAVEKIRLVKENRDLMARMKKDARKLKEMNEQLKEMAHRDVLTGLHNRRWFQKALEIEWARCRRYKRTFSLIMTDLDHFKKYNDTYGHPAGDEVLKNLARIFEKKTREPTTAARYGGEEFVILAPETDKKRARQLAERLREMVEDFPFKGKKSRSRAKVTLSLGIATYPKDGSDCETLINHADEALYKAKHKGRNRVCA